MIELGLDPDMSRHFSTAGVELVDPKVRKALVSKWKKQVVAPCIRRKEAEWFRQQLDGLSCVSILPYAELAPLQQPFALELRWAPWGKTMWRFYKAWCMARATCCIPAAVWGRVGSAGSGGLVETMAQCCLCDQRQVGLQHVLTECPCLLTHRSTLPPAVLPILLRWVLDYSGSFSDLDIKVRYFGLCVSTVVHGLPR